MLPRNYLLGLIFILLSTTEGEAQLGFTLANGAKQVEIPIEIYNNLVVVPVIINNQLPLKFIIDTGVRTTILTEKIYSDVLRVSYSKKFTISAPGGKNSVNAFITNNVTIDLPGVQGRGLAMMVLENDFLELKSSLGAEVHGILGYELFSRFVIKIDYQAKKLTLMIPQKFKPTRKYVRIPIIVEDTKPYCIAELKINDSSSISAKLMIDTGASHGLFLDTESNSKIMVPFKNFDCILGKGLGGVIEGHLARINLLQLGKRSMSGVITSFPSRNSYYDTIKFMRSIYRNGSIGGEVLSRFDVVFDFPNEKMYLKPNSSFRKKFYYNMSGLSVKATGQRLNEFEISEVRKGSPGFLAGIVAGDKILKINDNLTEDMRLGEVEGYFNSKPGKKITLELKRDSEILTKEFRIVNEL